MGKDKPPKTQPAPAKPETGGKGGGKAASEEKPANAGRGHKQRGAGTVITAKPAITTNDGITLKPHERLPSQLLHEYCQREKRPAPKYLPNPPGNRLTVLLEDSKNSKNDLRFSPMQTAESSTVARDYAALLALFHLQKTLPLERKLPEPYSTTWLDMLRAAKGEASPNPSTPSPATVKSVEPVNGVEAQSDSKKKGTGNNSNSNTKQAESAVTTKAVVIPAKLDRETADWLCDACTSQNFAKLLNGQPRLKCIRCQTPKSATCSLVATVTGAVPANGDNSRKKIPPKAITGLTTENKFVSKSESEQFQIQQRQERNRKMTFFDALKRVNRPKTIHFLIELRNKLEQLLGLQVEKSSQPSSQFGSSSENYHDLLEEIGEEGLIATDISELPYPQQASILQSILSRFEINEEMGVSSLTRAVKVLMERNLEVFVEDFIEETSNSNDSNEEIFEQILEIHLRNILSDESSLESNFNEDNEDAPSTNTITQMGSSKYLGSYSGVLTEYLRKLGWNSSLLNSNALEVITQKLFPSDSIEDNDTATALAILSHVLFYFVAYPKRVDPFLSSMHMLAPTKVATNNIPESIEEEIAVLQSMFSDQFQFSTISLQGIRESQQYYLFSLDFTDNFTLLKVQCRLKLQVLLSSELEYPKNLPFAALSLSEPSTIKNDKILGMLFDLNLSLLEKLSNLKDNLVTYELYSFLQEKLTADTGRRSISAPSRVDLTKMEDLIEAVTKGKIEEIPQILAPLSSVIAGNTPIERADEDEIQSMTTTSEADLTSAEPSITSSMKKEKNSFGPSFWNRNKNLKVAHAPPLFPSRRNLPAWKSREDFLNSLLNASTRAMIVTGETGCGKTTQIPQFIAEQSPSSKIVVCQPRRLAAIGVATRVAEEQSSRLGDRVGYMVKGDSKVSAQTTIAFCTYGVLLRRLQDDPTLEVIDYIILDEIHERGIDSDFTLALLIDAILKRSNLKLILMSATISTNLFQQYLSYHLKQEIVPILEIPGFTFPVTEVYKGDYEEVVRNYPIKALQSNYDEYDDEDDYGSSRKANSNMIPFRKKDIDYDLLCKLVFALIHPVDQSSTVVKKAEGCILIFLPGVPEINRFLQFFRTYYHRESYDDVIHLISLHGNVAPEEQLKIFHTYPRGHLKIIAATNVAEASVTIPDVTVVVDTCRVKEMDYNAEIQAYALTMKFAAKDSLRQRRGRAGRVQQGRCYRLITKGTYDKLPDNSIPEMLRLPLESILLQILSMNISIASTTSATTSSNRMSIPPACDYILNKCPNIPKTENVIAALQILSSLQAISITINPSSLDDENQSINSSSVTTVSTNGSLSGKILTPLGDLISRLPCHPRIGRLLIYGCLLDCVYPTLCVAATLTCRSPFIMANDSDSIQRVNQAKRKFGGSGRLKSDYNIIVNSIVAWERAKDSRKFCQNHGLIYERLIEIKQTMKDYLKDLAELGLISSQQRSSSYNDCLQYYEEQLEKVREQQIQQAQSGANGKHLRYEYLLSAIYCAGLYPQVCKILHPPKRFMEVMGAAVERDAEAKEVKYYLPKSQLINPQTDAVSFLTTTNARGVSGDYDISTDNLQRIFIHPSSVNFSNASYNTSNYLLYGEKSIANAPPSGNVKGNASNNNNQQEKIYIKDTCEVTAFALLLFGGALSYDSSKGLLLVDDWIRFACSERIAAIFFRIREEFHRVLQRKMENDRMEQYDLSQDPIMNMVKELLLTSLD